MDITSFWGLLCCLVLPGIALLVIVVNLLSSNKIQVEAGQWTVLQNMDGQYRAVGPGTHILSPGWKVAKGGVVDVGEKTKEVPKDSVNTRNQIPMMTGFRYTYVIGRRYRELLSPPAGCSATGWLEFDCADPLSLTNVDASTVTRFATTLKGGTESEESQVASAVKAAWEATLGSLDDKQITEIAKTAVSLPVDTNVPFREGGVQSKARLYEALAKEVVLRTNRILMPKGIGLTGMVVTDCDYDEKEVRDARAAGTRAQMLVSAARDAVASDPSLAGLDPAVKLVIGTDKFAEVVDSRGKVEAARLHKEAIAGSSTAPVGLAEALAKGALRGLIDIHDINVGGPPPKGKKP